jgi:hypothetical protein
VILRTT